MKNRTYLCSLPFLFAGCSGSPPASPGVAISGSTLTAQAGQASVEECPNGGVAFDYGLDANGNGVLDGSEVADTLVVCHGQDGATSYNNLSDIPTEQDPLFAVSEAAAITAADLVAWNAAATWGDHAAAGYLTSENDPAYAASVASGISSTQTTEWDAAYGWGDHSTAAYLKSENDPVYAASVAFGISSAQTTQWDTAYGWGSHTAAGYLSQSGGTLSGPLSGTSATFSGGVAVGHDAAACDTAGMGKLRFDPTTRQLSVCDGSRWASLHQHFSGQTVDDPAEDCLKLLQARPTAPSGAYWLSPAGYTGAPFITWCDMETDGGGWTMVGKVAGAGHANDGGVLDGVDVERWINRSYIGDMTDLGVETALGPAYESVPFNDFMLAGLHDRSKKMAWTHTAPISSMHGVIAAGTQVRADGLLFGDFTTLDYRASCQPGAGPDATGPEFYGFNINSDSTTTSGPLANGYTGGWCAAMAGWGRDNTAGGYAGGGLGAVCQATRGHQMARHFWGFGDGCDSHDWLAEQRLTTFHGHAFFVR